jgi:hypothetical protein
MRPKFFWPGDLDVEDMDRNAAALADRDRFLDAVAKLQAVVAQMRRIEAALGGLGDLAQLLDRGKGVGRIDQAGRHAKRALAHHRRHDLLHRADVFRRRLLVVLANDERSHGAGANVGKQVGRDAALFDRGEVTVEISPRRALRRRFSWALPNPTRRSLPSSRPA